MKFEKYFEKRTDEVDLLLKKTATIFTPSDFHRLRVEIKKINALFKFMAYSEKGFKKRSVFKPYKPVFARAGKIRELQQEKAAFKKYFGRDKFMLCQKGVKRSEFIEKRNFFKEVNISLRKDLKESNKIALSFLKRMKQKKLSEYLKMKEQKIKKIMKEELKPKEMHRLRKELKILYYNSKISKRRLGRSLGELKKLQDLLGKWHDGIVMNDHLEKAGKFTKQDSADSKRLRKIKKKISDENKKMFLKIKEELTPEYI